MSILATAIVLSMFLGSYSQSVPPPTNLSVTSKTATSITLRWNPVSNAIGYQVFHKKQDDVGNIWLNKTVGNKTIAVISGLKPYTVYLVQVLANTTAGTSNKSIVLLIRTDEALPNPPEGLTARFTSFTNLSISWTLLTADKANGIIHEYRYIIYEGSAVKVNNTVNNMTGNINSSDLNACREHVIKVAARTGAGTGNYRVFNLGDSCPKIIYYEPRVLARLYTFQILHCNFTGNPKPVVSWILNDNVNVPANHRQEHKIKFTPGGIPFTKTKTVYENGSLVISMVEPIDRGLYKCIVTNDVGSIVRNTTLVVSPGTISVKFNIYLQNLTNITDLKDKNSPRYKELKSIIVKTVGGIYENKTLYKVEHIETRIDVLKNQDIYTSIVVVASFKISQSVKDDDVKADIVDTLSINTQGGKLGSLSVKNLQVDEAPPPPTDLTVVRLGTTYVILRWKTPKHDDLYSLDTYSMKYKEHGQTKKFHTVKTVKNDGQVIHGLLDGLHAGKQYVVKIVSHGSIEATSDSETTKEIETPNPMMKTILLIIVLPVVLALLAFFLICFVVRLGCQVKKDENELQNIDGRPAGFREENPYDIGRLLQEFPCRWKELPRSDLTVGKELGAGAFGTVVRADYKVQDNNVPCAIKMLKAYATEREHRDLFNELSIMAQVGYHPNVISLIGACTTNGPLWVVVKLAENGCLIEYLHEHRLPDYIDHAYQNVPGSSNQANSEIEPLDKLQKLKFAHGIAKGMSHLEKKKCVHRDLAARNVLLGKHMIPMVSDFGLSRDIYESGMYEDCRGGKRPVRWMAPESIEDYTCTTKSDVWSFGVTMWEIETAGTVPYAGMDGGADILREIKNNYRLEKPSTCDDDVYDVMLSCWRPNPLNRPSFKDLTAVIEEMLTGISEYLEIQPDVDDEYQEVFTSPYDEVNIDTADLEDDDVSNGNVHVSPRGVLTLDPPDYGVQNENDTQF